MEYTVYNISLIPVIISLVYIARNLGLPVKYLPLLSIALGLAGGLVYIDPGNPKKAILDGVVMGLTAVGTWSGIKNTFEKRDCSKKE